MARKVTAKNRNDTAGNLTAGALQLTGNLTGALTVGVPYFAGVTATGGVAPYTFSVFSGSLPAGLTINASTGAVSGTPSGSAGTFAGQIRVTDASAATANLAYNYAVSAGSGLPTFTYNAKTTALNSAWITAGYTASAQEIDNLDYWISKMSTAGLLATGNKLFIYHDNKPVFLTDIVSATTGLTENTPANITYNTLAKSATAVLNTDVLGFECTGTTASLIVQGLTIDLVPRDHTLCIYTGTGVANTAHDVGTPDGTAGIVISAKNTASVPANIAIVRALGTTLAVSTDTATNYDGYAMIGYTREDASNVSIYKNGQLRGGGALASTYVAQTVGAVPFTWGRSRGTTTPSPRPQQAFFYSPTKLTAAQHDLLYRAVRSILECRMWGNVFTHKAGYAPSTVTADVVVYGITSGGIMAAYAAHRAGLSVALVSGWREQTLDYVGGMTAGGLGQTDMVTPSAEAASGLPDMIYRWVRAIENKVFSASQSEHLVLCRTANWIFRRLLDPSRTEGRNIPIYFSTGVTSVTKTSGNITSITTGDGRTFVAGTAVIDCSYEGDIVHAHGAITYTIGSEAQVSSDGNGWNAETGAGVWPVDIDPYVTAGVSGSGLLPRVITKPGYSIGDAVPYPQAFNFRMTLRNQSSTWTQFKNVVPRGYDPLRYEVNARYYAIADPTGTTLTFENVAIQNNLNMIASYDINGMDYLGASTDYVNTGLNYTARETLWQEHQDWTKGFYYWLKYSGEARIPPTILTDATAGLNRLGLPIDHYLNPHPNDEPYWSPYLYIREMRRMVGPSSMRRTDFTQVDGTTPRISQHTCAVSNYRFDRHPTIAYAETTGTPRVVRTGGLESTIPGGNNNWTPIPFEVILPNPTECKNLAAPFAPQMNAVCFGAYRMELTFMMASYMAGIAAATAKAKGVDLYTAATANYSGDANCIVEKAAAVTLFTNETVPNLPTVN